MGQGLFDPGAGRQLSRSPHRSRRVAATPLTAITPASRTLRPDYGLVALLTTLPTELCAGFRRIVTTLARFARPAWHPLPGFATLGDVLPQDQELPDTKEPVEQAVDVYFSVDVETDGPIPGPYSMLSFALVPAGRSDGTHFTPPTNYDDLLYLELRPISPDFEPEAMQVHGLDRDRLVLAGADPKDAMLRAEAWVRQRCLGGQPVLVAYPLGFDWSWLHWYFTRYLGRSPFLHSRAFDLKTAISLTEGIPVSRASRSRLPESLRPQHAHTHHAADDAIAQAQIFAHLMSKRELRSHE